MSDRAAFMKRIIEDKFSDAPRLVFADWLEEHGDPLRAEFIRIQIEIENAMKGCSCGSCMRRHGPGPHQHTNGPCAASRLKVKVNGERQPAYFRSHTLLEEHGKQWLADDFCGSEQRARIYTNNMVFTRGFMAEIETTGPLWVEQGDWFTSRAPIERVKLMTMFTIGISQCNDEKRNIWGWTLTWDGSPSKYRISDTNLKRYYDKYQNTPLYPHVYNLVLLKAKWPDIEFILPK